jgi:hypothetical protein
VERAGHLVVGGEREPDELRERRDGVRQVGDEVLVVLVTNRSDVAAGVIDKGVDRALDLEPGESPATGVKRIFAAHTDKSIAARCVMAP